MKVESHPVICVPSTAQFDKGPTEQPHHKDKGNVDRQETLQLQGCGQRMSRSD